MTKPKVTQMFPDAAALPEAVTDTLAALTLDPADAGAVQLARDYATAIDQADDQADALDRLGPKLLACLETLGATPAARAKTTKQAGADKPASELDKLRASRRKA